MLGIGGKFAGAKGMVQMPDLANLNPEQANTLLTANGLRTKNQNSNNTTNSSLNNKVFGQSVSAGQLVDYETEIDFSYYVYAAPAVVITYGPQEPYDTVPEYGCNKTPNVQGASNQYYYCSRNIVYKRSKKYENGIWNGEYGQYATEVDANWNCTIVQNQCGNVEISKTEVVGTRSGCIGSPGTTGYQNVTYRINYAAGSPTNVTRVEQESGCFVPAPVTEVPCSTPTRSETISKSSCKCGQARKTYNRICNSSTGAFIREEPGSETCIETPGTTYTTPVYWFACNADRPGLKKGTYRIETYDCAGTLISNLRYELWDPCCTASCGSWSAWIRVGASVELRTRTCTKDDCSTETETETRCIQRCDIWRDVSGCLGTYRIQQRKCQAADCSFYYETRNVACY